MKDLTTISTDLFNKVRSRFSNVKLGDQAGTVITDPAKARFFDLDFTHEGSSIGHVNIKIDEKSLTVIYSDSMVEGQNSAAKDDWYKFLKELRMFAKSNMLNFDTRDITKTNLDKRDYEYLAQENGDMKMSESKLWGTSKTSFQDMGEAKIIVKHSQPVNYALPAGRTMHIDSIYIENAQGERFRYPHRHLNGARAMAVHVANGGTVYDNIGTHISGLSEELSKLRQFKNYTQRNGLQEALSDISDLVITRISDIKEQIAKLQRQNYYAEFAESFSPVHDLPIPEETVNNWVDALTIRTFNEELTSVFPFIYKLTNQPKALSYDELVGESEEQLDERATPEWLELVGKAKELFAKGLTPEQVAKQLGVEEPNNNMAGPMGGKWGAINSAQRDLQKQQKPAFESSEDNKVCDVCEKSPCECDDENVKEHNHLADFEQHLEDITTFEYDVGVVEEPNEGNEFAQKVQMLKAQGAEPGTKFTTSDGEEHTLKDAIEAFGMTLEDFWTEDELAEMQSSQRPNAREVVEFIMSMYDQEQGTFPKGEEGVKIAVEKKFGDHAGQFAGQVVERLSAKEQTQPDFDGMQTAIQEAADATSAAALKAAIEKFQQAAGIKVDGKYGPETSTAYQAAISGKPAAAPATAPAPGGNPATGVNAQGQNVGMAVPDETGAVNPNIMKNPETGELYKPGQAPAGQQAKPTTSTPAATAPAAPGAGAGRGGQGGPTAAQAAQQTKPAAGIATNTAASVMPQQATAGNLSAQPAPAATAPAAPGGQTTTKTTPTPGGQTTTTTTNTSVSGNLKMGKPDGPIQYNGKTVQPGDPQYAAASQALIAQQGKIQQTRDQMRAPRGAPSTAPVQMGKVSADRQDF